MKKDAGCYIFTIFDKSLIFNYKTITMKKNFTKLTPEEIDTLNKKLVIGKCPNCNSEKDKLCVGKFEYIKLNIENGEVDLTDMLSFPVILFTCPDCGVLTTFNYKFICQ